RPTLADVGLIAPEGKGSLVGTAGFMSPKLLSGKGSADTSDDFYALGKVIYCALTGLPVGEYPSIPENMTISVDASLGRAFRESCKQPVRTSAEFRKLLAGKAAPEPPKSNDVRMTVQSESAGWLGNILLILALLVLLTTGLLVLYAKSAEGGQKVPKRVPSVSTSKGDAESEEKLKQSRARLAEAQAKARAEIQKFNSVKHGAAGAGYLKEIQDRTVKLFREAGLLPGNGNMASVLINYQVMGGKEIQNLILTSNRTPRLVPTAGVHPRRSPHYGATRTERELQYLFSVAYRDFDSQDVKSHQKFWRGFPGAADRIQQQMLETDPVMQALALDAMIRAEANAILKNGFFRRGEKSQLGTLFELRHGLLHPEKGKPSFLQWFAE
ncbi:MAG: hypothetical protein J5858_15020, partial [Lentisphaeria bacterium]|nr:hypothetical protein [Lentisphaeria bacterium]